MPWKVNPVSQIRQAFVLQVRNLQTPVAAAARNFGISRMINVSGTANPAEPSTRQ